MLCTHQIFWKKWEYNEAVPQLFIDCRKAYDSFRREDNYNVPIDIVIPTIPVRLIKMCMNETCNTVRVGKHLCDVFFFIKFGLK
jgi:hypothetical protein